MGGQSPGSGTRYHAQAFALLATHALIRQPLHWFDDVDDIPIAISVETSGPGDDLRIELGGGTQIEVQAKRGLKTDSKLWNAILRITRGLERDPNLRGVLLIDTRSSQPIREDLREDIVRLGQGRIDKLKDITQKMIRRLAESDINSDEQLLSRFRIVLSDLDEGRAGHAAAQAFLIQIVADPADAQKAWTLLEKEGINLISIRGRRDHAALTALLTRNLKLAPEYVPGFQPTRGDISESELLETTRELLKQVADLRSDLTQVKKIPEYGLGHNLQMGTGAPQDFLSFLPQAVIDVALSLAPIVSDISGDKVDQVEHARELYRQGKGTAASSLLTKIREQATWGLLPNAVKGRVIRLAASLALNTRDDLIEARNLATEALVVDPHGDNRIINALLTLREQGPEQALTELKRPDNVDCFNLRLHLLLLLGRSDDLIGLANDPHDSVVANAETRRLKSLALLLIKDLQRARDEINEALREKPEWETIQVTAGLIDYFSALLIGCLPSRLLDWPQPVPPAVVKQDDVSQGRLVRAEERFCSVRASTERGSEYVTTLDVWRIACLGNTVKHRDKSEALCKDVLKADPANQRALLWALARGYGVDVATSEFALKEAIESKVGENLPERIERIVALVLIYILSERGIAALDLLERTKPLFMGTGHDNIWLFWDAQVLVANGEAEKALTLLTPDVDTATRCQIRTTARRAVAARLGEWADFAAYLRQCYEETLDGVYLLELCELQARLGEWREVEINAGRLVDEIGTPDAIRLAAWSKLNTGNPQACADLIESTTERMPGASLPADIHWLLVRAWAASGQLSKAKSEAEGIVAGDDSTANLLRLIDIQREVGDLLALAATARRLLGRTDVSGEGLLRAAFAVRFQSREIAKEFWLRAIATPDENPEFVMSAVSLGFELGLDEKVSPLFSLMQRFASASEGPIRVYDLEQLSSWAGDRAKKVRETNEEYRRGRLPIHAFSQIVDLPLTDVFHGIPEANRVKPDPLRQPDIYIRHGGRPLPETVTSPSSEGRLFMDVTALLVASDLGVLDKVEQHYKTIYISDFAITLFLSERSRLQTHQPSTIEEYRHILDLLDKGTISLLDDDESPLTEPREFEVKMGPRWARALRRAQAEKGFIVDYLPLTSRGLQMEPVELEPVVMEHVTDCHAIAASLEQNSIWPKRRIDDAVARLPRQPAGLSATVPPLGSQLFLMGNIASALEGAGLLSTIAERFKVFVDPIQIEVAKGQISESDRRTKLDQWLTALIGRINRGVENGTYLVVPIFRTEEDRNEANNESFNPCLRALEPLLSFEPQSGDTIWVDDRYVNAYTTRARAPIIGVSEGLKALHEGGAFDNETYYDALLRLRSGNYRWIPIEPDEILFHLRQSKVIEGALVETGELSVVRRYVAACLSEPEYLQRPPLPKDWPNQTGELAFVQGVINAVFRSIVAVWRDVDADMSVATARADWLLASMYTGIFGLRDFSPGAEAGERFDAYALGLDIGSLFVQGISIFETLKDSTSTGRKEFFAWVSSRLGSRRFATDPKVRNAAADTIKKVIIASKYDRYDDEKERRLTRLVCQQFFFELPDELRQELAKSDELMDWLGLTSIETLKIGPVTFMNGEFVSAAEKAMRGKTPTIVAADSQDKYTLHLSPRQEDQRILIEVLDSSGAVVASTLDSICALLESSPGAREEILRRHPHWFDRSARVFQKEARKIARTKNPVERLRRCVSWRSRSCEVFYRQLYDSRLRGVHRDRLIPRFPGELPQHYRIDEPRIEETQFSDTAERAADILLEEVGLRPTIERLACLPVRMPSRVVQRLRAVDETERSALYSECSSRWGSPVSLLNLVDLILQTGPMNEETSEIARTTLRRLFDGEHGTRDLDLFEALLEFVSEQFWLNGETASWSTKTRLAMVWAHASRLHNIMSAAGVLSDRVTSWIAQSVSVSELLARTLPYWNDVLHPRRFSRPRLLVHGLSAILEGQDRDVLDMLETRSLLRSVIYATDGEETHLDSEFIRDNSLQTNLLGSFVGGNVSDMLAQLNPESAARGQLASHALHEQVRIAIEKLSAEPSDQTAWATLMHIVGDLPIYKDLICPLTEVIRNLNLDALRLGDALAGELAVGFATLQLCHLDNDDLRAKLRDSLVHWVQAQANSSEQRDEETFRARAHKFLEYALSVSLQPGDPEGTSLAFGRLLHDFLAGWPRLAEYYGPILLGLAHDLPAHQLHGIWPALVRCRALSTNQVFSPRLY